MILPGSYANGFAPRDGQPLYPELWRGCVGAWAPCLGPTGLTLQDWSGFGNHGTLTNMVAGDDWVTSQGRYALDFDGSNDSVNSPLVVNNSAGFSISIWQRFNAYTSSFPVLIKLAMSSSAGAPFFLFWSTTAGYEGLNIGSSSYFSRQRTNTPVSVGIWQHVAVTCEGNGSVAGSYKVYLNGASSNLIASGTYAVVSNVTQVGTTGGAGTFFDGCLDDLRAYNRALTVSDVKSLASRRGIAYELAPRRRSSVQVAAFNRRRRLLVGAGS